MLLSAPELLKTQTRSVVVRAQVRGGPVPGVILKHFRDEPVCGLDDWAGAEFVTRRAPELGPRFLAGNVDARLFVLEDLGRGRSLEELLRGDDARAAAGGLLATARLTGQLHARTMGLQSEYDLVRQALPPRHQRIRVENARFLLEHEGRLLRWLSEVGVAAAPGLHEDLETVARTLADPGPFLTFTHGDLAPGNVLFAPGGPRLLDFEYAGMRHALYDALMWLVTVPFPDELVSRADITYRITLSSQCEAAQVDSQWALARATVALARTVNLFQWLPPRVLEEDREWAPGLSERAALLHHLARCHALLASTDGFPGLARTLESLESRLRERWPVPPFVWPALHQAGL
ncbi:phosphotransferase family protein [Vitiosangium sp. GDMCC 1.1324]|uniref:phosphotransferase family protein n=1 Tax=Vitiosangium sp. (strain GDMCC 1.1324) TaxID=2138576 RepID=UPI00130DF55F|nr:phosphotransferase [Vitiosangium sp. GDMCC 1.1324]